MKFATYKERSGRELVGSVSAAGDRVYSLKEMGFEYADMVEFIAAYDETVGRVIADKMAAMAGEPLAEVTLDAPIPHPPHDILCIGQNYTEHALEMARYRNIEYVKPAHPCYFTKRVDRAVPPGGPIKAHDDLTSKLDYESELAVVIGKRCQNVKPEDVFKHIFGYTVVNDVSARDLQTNHVQYTFAKGLDSFTPMGPWIVTRDALPEPPQLAVRSWVNGELRQNSNTSEFIFDIPFMISQLSSGITLLPGDVFITGTPSGVGMGFNPPRFIKAGDVIEVEVEGIGKLSNPVV